jgi:hypothetical protein
MDSRADAERFFEVAGSRGAEGGPVLLLVRAGVGSADVALEDAVIRIDDSTLQLFAFRGGAVREKLLMFPLDELLTAETFGKELQVTSGDRTLRIQAPEANDASSPPATLEVTRELVTQVQRRQRPAEPQQPVYR